MMPEGYQLQYDEQGRPYYQFPGQPKNYVSPVAMGQPAPQDTTGPFHKAPEWNQNSGSFETPIDWGNILSVGTGAALTGGALSAAGAFGGAAGGAAGAAGAAPEIGLTSSIVPAGATAGGVTGAAAAGGATAAASPSILGSLGLNTPQGILGAAGRVAPVLGGAAASRGAQQSQNYELDLLRRAYQLGAPATRLKTAQRASMVANAQPSSVSWGGPGSGLRGETAKFSGAFSNPDMYSPDVKTLANDIAHKQMLASLSGEDTIPPPSSGGTADTLLGGGSLIASLLAALGTSKQAPPVPGRP